MAKRGNKDRNQVIRQALERAEHTFESAYGFSRGGIKAWTVTISNPTHPLTLEERFAAPKPRRKTKQP